MFISAKATTATQGYLLKQFSTNFFNGSFMLSDFSTLLFLESRFKSLEGGAPLALQPVKDAGLALSPCVVHQLQRQVNSSHLQTSLQRTGELVVD